MEEETKTFGEFAISEEMLSAISDMGFEEPTPIQQMAIPQILEGKDGYVVIYQKNKTGIGSTVVPKKWAKGIKWKVLKYKYLFKFLFVHFPYQAADMMNWNYLSNSILDKLLKIISIN